MDMPETIFDQGLYPLPDAARLAQLDPRIARRWAEGYDFKYRGETRHRPGVMALTLPAVGRQVDLTFPELLTLRLVKGFRDTGLSLRTIKRVAWVAARDYGTPTPFVSQRFRTDGRRIFMELERLEPSNDDPAVSRHDLELIEVLSGQRAFAEIVEPSLFARVDWVDDMAARWWPLGQEHAVVLDPKVMFGAPRVRDSRLATSTVAAAVRAEGGGEAGVAAVADWYGIPSAHVRDAAEFETEWLRRAA